MSLRQYADARGVNHRTLAWWRWRLRSERRQSARPERFVPVVVQAPVERAPEVVPAGQVEAALPNGVTLRFEHRLDVDGLRDLAAAFGEA